MTVIGIAVATVAAVVISAVVYGAVSVAGPEVAPQRPPAAQLATEVLRNLAVAALVTGLLTAADRSGPGAGAALGLALWIIPVVLLAGSVFHEGVPPRRAALHAVDWLLKLIAIGVVVGLFT